MHTSYNTPIAMLATASNNLGVGAVIGGIVAPMVRGDIDGLASFVVWLLIGLDFVWLARIILGQLRS